MSIELENFRRVLSAFIHDPMRADQLVEQVAAAAVHGCDALRQAMADEIANVIVRASAERQPFGNGRPDRQRIDAIALSPGGVQVHGRIFGKAVLSDILGCKIDEGHRPAILDQSPFAAAFAAVRDGMAPTVWVDFAHGQACFAAARPELTGEARERPDCIFALFITQDMPDDRRRDPAPVVAPIGLGKLVRNVDPTTPKSPRDWLNSTPDRRIFKLNDGRRMATRWYGAAHAPAVIVFCAAHKSTMADPYFANAAIKSGRALFVIERPGSGISDPAPAASYTAVADDVAQIVKALDLRDLTVYGGGSAASFALATAVRLGGLVRAVALNAPRIGKPSAEAPSRYGRVFWALMQNTSSLEVLARLIMQMRILGPAQSLISAFAATNDRDTRLLKEDGVLAYAAAQAHDAFHLTASGGIAEFRLHQSGAYFDPALVTQPIRVWQGDEDRTLLMEDTRRSLAGAPNVSFEIMKGAGSIMDTSEAASIMQWLAGGWAGQKPASDSGLDDGL